MLPKCSICAKSRSQFVMNNKTVCMSCDELMFDLEIECEEEPRHTAKLISRTEPVSLSGNQSQLTAKK